jgi:hypothetical protein
LIPRILGDHWQGSYLCPVPPNVFEKKIYIVKWSLFGLLHSQCQLPCGRELRKLLFIYLFKMKISTFLKGPNPMGLCTNPMLECKNKSV